MMGKGSESRNMLKTCFIMSICIILSMVTQIHQSKQSVYSSQYLLQVTSLQQRHGKMSSLVSKSSPAQCLLTSSVSHELFIETEIRNYVKEAAHKSPWLGIVNQSITRGGDNAVETASQSYFSCFAACRMCGPGVEGKDTFLLISGSSFCDLNVYHLV